MFQSYRLMWQTCTCSTFTEAQMHEVEYKIVHNAFKCQESLQAKNKIKNRNTATTFKWKSHMLAFWPIFFNLYFFYWTEKCEVCISICARKWMCTGHMDTRTFGAHWRFCCTHVVKCPGSLCRDHGTRVKTWAGSHWAALPAVSTALGFL